MKTLYIDCSMGAAGDMLSAALLELLPDQQAFVNTINCLGIPGVQVRIEKSVKCGITGTHYTVSVYNQEEDEHLHDHTHDHHHHSSLHDLQHLIWNLNLPLRVKNDALAVYELIAKAEAHAHGVEELHHIHFHEVGSLDAVTDIVSVCYLFYLLKPEKIMASPIHVGSGTVRCAHGILPVPAPATAHILQGIPIYGGSIQSELCTPTGAALLKHFVSKFDAMPLMATEKIGYGMGKKDFPQANCVRALLGESQRSREQVLELVCNLDDMTGEAMGFAMERLLEAGALDVFTTAIGMKKSRPGIMLTVICKEQERDPIVKAIFHHTSTLGIRENICNRYTLDRTICSKQTPYGIVREKVSTGYGTARRKMEYEDLAQIAREQGRGFEEIRMELL